MVVGIKEILLGLPPVEYERLPQDYEGRLVIEEVYSRFNELLRRSLVFATKEHNNINVMVHSLAVDVKKKFSIAFNKEGVYPNYFEMLWNAREFSSGGSDPRNDGRHIMHRMAEEEDLIGIIRPLKDAEGYTDWLDKVDAQDGLLEHEKNRIMACANL